ncbi:importin-4 [Alligator mississippiensis]|uniref:Importin-4 n=1 Tax=Alligator mississippiensis TaxID=8496 RepID=A0A151NCB9_ALLMI|nr:importin-4 [Alligator mississippiensis]
MEPAGLERVLGDLLQPDTGLIQRATVQLREAFRHPGALALLCHVLRNSPSPQIRQFAAVLARRRLTRVWKKLPPPEQERLKTLVLEALEQETEHAVLVALAQLAALLLHRGGVAGWPQALSFIQQGALGPEPQRAEVSLLVLSSALEAAPEALAPHCLALLRLCHRVLAQPSSPGALHYCLRALAAMAPSLGSDHLNLTRSLIPKIISAVKQLIPVNEAQASEAMEVFDELMETEVAIIVPHLSEVVGFCLEVASDQALGDAVRVKALGTISFLIKLKGKALVRQRLVPVVLGALFPVLSAAPPPGRVDPEDEDEDAEDPDGGLGLQTPKHAAAQVIDMLALHLPPEKLFTHLMPLVQGALGSADPYQRKAALMCLAVLAEGCGDHIRSRHLQELLGVLCRALGDASPAVRGAALFALGQFSENLQPDIAAFAGDVLPLLQTHLGTVEPGRGPHLAKAYYALENFLESLGTGIEPFLPGLMEHVLGTLRGNAPPRTKELVISTLGAIASAAQGALLPYFPALLDQLRPLLLPARPDLRPIQVQAVGFRLLGVTPDLH